MHNLKPETPKASALAKHSKFIRSIGYCVAKRFRSEPCEGPIESCHVRQGFYCMSRKPVGAEVPMCSGHHRTQHQKGERNFWPDVEAAKRLASDLWENTGDWAKACEFIVRF